MKRIFWLTVALALTSTPCLQAGILNGRLNLALGQKDLSHTGVDFTDGIGLTQAQSVVVDTASHRLFVMDSGRALLFDDYTALSDGQSADAVLGQPDLFASSAGGPAATSLNFPGQGFIDASGALWVADTNYSRVLRFSPPFATGMVPDLVLGQAAFTSAGHATTDSALWQPQGLAQDPSGRVWVSDTSNHRVLRFSPPFATGMSADLVLGQADMVSGAANRGGAPAADSLKYPGPLAFDAAGDLWVADSYNHRLLRFDAPIAAGASASRVLGQADFASGLANAGVGAGAGTLFTPSGLAVDALGNVWVSDTVNSRLLRYDAPIASSMNASLVLGQAGFASRAANRGGPAAADGLNQPGGLALDAQGALWVSDVKNSRVLRFGPAFVNGMSASRVLGQPDFAHNTQNLVDAKGLHNPWFAVVDGTHDRAFVADAGNNRVLWWNNASALVSGKPADGVLGHADVYTNFTGPLSAKTLNYPLGLAVDSGGALWVADDINSRVLRFSPPFATGMSADLVLGQPNFVSSTTLPLSPPTAASFNVPYGLAIDTAGALLVADNANGRVLRFRPPFSNGMSADLVLGQAGFGAPVTSPVSPSLLGNPTGLTVDPTGAVWAADYGFSRVVRFTPPLASGMAADLILGQPAAQPDAASMSGPTGVALNQAGALWVADTFNNRLLGFAPPFSSGMAAAKVLGQPDFASSDAGDGDTGYMDPSGVFVDASDALWLADNAHSRVLKYIGEDVRSPVGTSSSQTIRLDGQAGALKLDLPAGAFVHDVAVSMSVPAVATLPPVADGMKASTVAVQITTDLGLQPLKPLALSVSYRDSDVAGLVLNRLAIAYFSPASGHWVGLPSTCDPAAHTVTAALPHLSLFRLVQLSAAGDLGGVYVYPNPYKPGSGTVFDDTALGPGVVFAGLTASARIRILTLAGELVADVTTADGQGRYLWNAQNRRGERVAAGVYVYVVTNPNDRSQTHSGRFAIIR